MSLLNAFVTPTEAIVAVDSIGIGPDGGRLPSSKLLIVPHLNAVLGFRGQAVLLAFTYMRILSSGFESFDQMSDALPDILVAAEEGAPEHLLVDLAGAVMGVELLAAGYSEKHKRMLGLQIVRRSDKPVIARFTDFHVSPWHGSLEGTPTKAQHVDKLAAAQVCWMRSTFDNAACGGQLLTCRVTRASLTLSHKPINE